MQTFQRNFLQPFSQKEISTDPEIMQSVSLHISQTPLFPFSSLSLCSVLFESLPPREEIQIPLILSFRELSLSFVVQPIVDRTSDSYLLTQAVN